MTAPYLPEAAERVRQSLEHVGKVTVHPIASEPFELHPESLSIQFSEDWSPHIQANLSAIVPLSQAHLDALDGRAACRLSIDAGYVYQDRVRDVNLLADLGLRTRDVDRPANTMDLTAASDEARAQDYLDFTNVTRPPTTGLNELVDYLANYSIQPEAYTLNSEFGPGHAAAELADLEVPTGTSYWDVMDDAGSRTGTWIYCDTARTWRITQRETATAAPAAALTVGKDATLTSTRTTLGRDGWYNAVIVRHTWTDSAGTDRTAYGRARVSSGPLSVYTVGYKTKLIERSTPATAAQADRSAETACRSLASRGRSLSLTAIAAYWLRPGHTIAVTLSTGGTEHHLIKSVQFDPLAGLMTIETRQPLTADITLGE